MNNKQFITCGSCEQTADAPDAENQCPNCGSGNWVYGDIDDVDIKLYFCPHCETNQEHLINTQEVTAMYEYNLTSQEYERKDDIAQGGDSQWYCPNCDHLVTSDELKKLDII